MPERQFRPDGRPGRAAWSLYAGAGRAAAPLGRPYLAYRAGRGKEDERRLEKLGRPSHTPFQAAPVWIHAVSAGESVAALTIAERLIERGERVLMTTATPTSVARVGEAAGEHLVHQYAPLDAPPFVRAFLDHWRPRAALFTESEVWPTTLAELGRRQLPRISINARLSDRSYARWRSLPWLARPLFGLIQGVAAQSERQAERFASLGAGDALATGNLKFDAPPPVVDPDALARLRAAIGDRPVWLAASTHAGEEAVVLAAHRALRDNLADVLTIIAPRHPARAEAVATLAQQAGSLTRRSRGEPPSAEIFLADLFGELPLLLASAPITFLGGSLVRRGGHNPAEPAALGSALLTGPSHGEMFEPFLSARAATVVRSADELGVEVQTLLTDPDQRGERVERARRTLKAERGACERTMAALDRWLPAQDG